MPRGFPGYPAGRGQPRPDSAGQAAKTPGWPDVPRSVPCDHAGLLLFPGIADLQLPGRARRAAAAIFSRPASVAAGNSPSLRTRPASRTGL